MAEQAKKKILLVDDSMGVRGLVLRILRDLYEIAEAGSAESAIEALKAGGFHPDLILTDVNMSGGSGFDLLTEAKTCGLVPAARWIIMSDVISETQAAYDKKARGLGAEFLPKNKMVSLLPDLVEKMLG